MCKSILLAFCVCIFVICVVPCQACLAQITSLNIPIPEPVIRTYPFITDKFYYVDAVEIDGSQGYFVMTFDKARLSQFYLTKATDTLQSILRTLGFYRNGACYVDPDLCGLLGVGDHTILQDYHLDSFAPQNSIGGVNSELDLSFRYSFNARLKYVTYHSSLWPLRICERQVDYGPDFKLIDISLMNSLWFYKASHQKMNILNDVAVSGNVIWSGCNWACEPYCAPSSYQRDFRLITQLDFSEFGEMFLLFIENTRTIKITEDVEYYYVYFINKA